MKVVNMLGIQNYFDYIVQVNRNTKSKPEPQIFLEASRGIGVNPEYCIVFEDSISGCVAAKRAGMRVVAIGSRKDFDNIDLEYVIPSLKYWDFERMALA
ncbi:HAD family hydrolase [Tepidibacillus infernus]|uniref:HAD family hydrolase n=1 Tax=Tepidibacillus infernus TaxID=1806172 RepID=UPI003B74C8BA